MRGTEFSSSFINKHLAPYLNKVSIFKIIHEKFVII